MTDIVTEVEDLFKTIEKDAVVAWDDFLKGVHWLATEAAVLAKWAENVDPAIQQQIQDLITAGENAAKTLADYAQPAVQNLIAEGADLAEQTAANMIQKATGNSPLGVAGSALATSGIADLGAIFSNLATVGFTKAFSALASAAKP